MDKIEEDILTEFSIRDRSSSLQRRWSFVKGSATPFLLKTTLQSPTFAACNSPSFNSTLAAQAPLLTSCKSTSSITKQHKAQAMMLIPLVQTMVMNSRFLYIYIYMNSVKACTEPFFLSIDQVKTTWFFRKGGWNFQRHYLRQVNYLPY